MKVFVTGATGYIGRGLLRALFNAGHDVVGLARDRERAGRVDSLPVNWVIGNLRDARTFRDEAASCDALVHLGFEGGPDAASVDRGAAEALVHLAAGAAVPRVVLYTSGIWVLGEMSAADSADETSSLTNPAPLVTFRVETERFVLESGSGRVVTAVVRPGIVFGGAGGILDGMWAAAEKGEPPTVIGDGHNNWPVVHRADAADLYVRLLESAFTRVQALGPSERVFHATAPAPERPSDIARAVARATGRPDEVRFWPLAEARGAYGPFADALAMNQQVLSTRSESVLGWRPRVKSFVRSAPEMYAEWKAGA